MDIDGTPSDYDIETGHFIWNESQGPLVLFGILSSVHSLACIILAYKNKKLNFREVISLLHDLNSLKLSNMAKFMLPNVIKKMEREKIFEKIKCEKCPEYETKSIPCKKMQSVQGIKSRIASYIAKNLMRFTKTPRKVLFIIPIALFVVIPLPSIIFYFVYVSFDPRTVVGFIIIFTFPIILLLYLIKLRERNQIPLKIQFGALTKICEGNLDVKEIKDRLSDFIFAESEVVSHPISFSLSSTDSQNMSPFPYLRYKQTGNNLDSDSFSLPFVLSDYLLLSLILVGFLYLLQIATLLLMNINTLEGITDALITNEAVTLKITFWNLLNAFLSLSLSIYILLAYLFFIFPFTCKFFIFLHTYGTERLQEGMKQKLSRHKSSRKLYLIAVAIICLIIFLFVNDLLSPHVDSMYISLILLIILPFLMFYVYLFTVKNFQKEQKGTTKFNFSPFLTDFYSMVEKGLYSRLFANFLLTLSYFVLAIALLVVFIISVFDIFIPTFSVYLVESLQNNAVDRWPTNLLFRLPNKVTSFLILFYSFAVFAYFLSTSLAFLFITTYFLYNWRRLLRYELATPYLKVLREKEEDFLISNSPTNSNKEIFQFLKLQTVIKNFEAKNLSRQIIVFRILIVTILPIFGFTADNLFRLFLGLLS